MLPSHLIWLWEEPKELIHAIHLKQCFLVSSIEMVAIILSPSALAAPKEDLGSLKPQAVPS